MTPYGYVATPPGLPAQLPTPPVVGSALSGCPAQQQPGPSMQPYGYVATTPALSTQPPPPVGSAANGYSVQQQPGQPMHPFGYVAATPVATIPPIQPLALGSTVHGYPVQQQPGPSGYIAATSVTPSALAEPHEAVQAAQREEDELSAQILKLQMELEEDAANANFE